MANSGREPRESEADAGSAVKAPGSGYFDETLSIRGAFQAGVSTLDNVSLELVIGTGRTSGKREFLVPYFDVEVDGSFFPHVIHHFTEGAAEDEEADEDPRASVSVTLTFDNVAFVLERVSKRYRKLAKTMIGISGGDLGPVPGRVVYAVSSLRSASAALAAAAEDLEASLLKKEDRAEDETADESDRTD